MNPLYNHVVEVGAGDRASSEALNETIWRQAGRITLYEPNPVLHADLAKARNLLMEDPASITNGFMSPFQSRVKVVQAALSDASGVADLVLMGYASYVVGAPSFLATSVEPEGEAHWKPITREVVVLDTQEADTGDWTFLILTCNGCELDVLTRMKSRPQIIRTKHYLHNARQWAELARVDEWAKLNGYIGVIRDTNRHHTYYAMEWHKARGA